MINDEKIFNILLGYVGELNDSITRNKIINEMIKYLEPKNSNFMVKDITSNVDIDAGKIKFKFISIDGETNTVNFEFHPQ